MARASFRAVLVGITTGGKIGLGVVALVFIGFAIACSFLLPRRNPDFPGDRLRSFIWVTVLLFVALMAAVVVFARESEEEAHAGETVAHETTETGETGRRRPRAAAAGRRGRRGRG